jgi:hypothetical protein
MAVEGGPSGKHPRRASASAQRLMAAADTRRYEKEKDVFTSLYRESGNKEGEFKVEAQFLILVLLMSPDLQPEGVRA